MTSDSTSTPVETGVAVGEPGVAGLAGVDPGAAGVPTGVSEREEQVRLNDQDVELLKSTGIGKICTHVLAS